MYLFIHLFINELHDIYRFLCRHSLTLRRWTSSMFIGHIGVVISAFVQDSKVELVWQDSHITKHIPYFRETAVKQSWMCKADWRTEHTRMLDPALGNAHMLFPIQADSIKSNSHAGVIMLPEGGWGPGQWLMWTKNVQSAYLSSLDFLDSLWLLTALRYFHF